MTTSRSELEARGYRSVARIDEISDERPYMLEVDGRQLALYRVEGEYYATDGICPHAAGPLGAGDLEGFEVICPLHGWSFDIRNGECTNVKGVDIPTIALEAVEGELFLQLRGLNA